jgi:hypothetical protein
MVERKRTSGHRRADLRADVVADLHRLHRLRPNFDRSDLGSVARYPWHVDDYCHELPAEQPGEPTKVGSFAAAKRLLYDYEFADPTRVCAYYETDATLEGRDMLLEIRYLGVRVRVGVRITEVIDEVRDFGGKTARIWGWAYQTLEGHLERGQMDYQLWKWLDTGAIEYRIHAVSQMAEIRNPLLYLGFRLVGRREQIQFARRCGDRMEGFVRLGLAHGVEAVPRPREVLGILASPSSP